MTEPPDADLDHDTLSSHAHRKSLRRANHPDVEGTEAQTSRTRRRRGKGEQPT